LLSALRRWYPGCSFRMDGGPIMRPGETHKRPHGPENAEYELRKAYNCIVEAGVTHLWNRRPIPDVDPEEVLALYNRAFDAYRKGERLAAERWSRTAKHLARAFWHEAKIAYLEPHEAEIPYLAGGTAEEYNLHEHSDTTADLLDSLSMDVPSGHGQIPAPMLQYLTRARKHLKKLEEKGYKHELLRAERIKAAHEYGRTVECMALAYEADATGKKTSAA